MLQNSLRQIECSLKKYYYFTLLGKIVSSEETNNQSYNSQDYVNQPYLTLIPENEYHKLEDKVSWELLKWQIFAALLMFVIIVLMIKILFT